MVIPLDPRRNHLINGLPPSTWTRLQPYLEPVQLHLGQTLHAPHEPLMHVYFPVDSIVVLLHVMEDGSTAEIGLVGNEGMVGVTLFMGGDAAPAWSVIQSPGYAYRLAGHHLNQEFDQSKEFQHLLLCYTQALLSQMAQTAACNRRHKIEQQLCRWLLLSIDRLSSNELNITQETIASMLGVRREGVTAAASKLQKAGLIRYRRGRITVVDREGLEQLCCECYRSVRREYDRLLPGPSNHGRPLTPHARERRGVAQMRAASVGRAQHLYR